MTSPIEPTEMPRRIFISHSHQDDAFGIRLVDDLRRALGNDDAVWFDSHGGLHGGVAWWRTIVTEITERPVFLVILSPESLGSSWVQDEIDLAWQQKNQRAGKQIIPVLYRQCEPRADLTMLQYISFLPPVSYEDGFTALLTALQSPPAGGRRPVPTGAPPPMAPMPPVVPASLPTPPPPTIAAANPNEITQIVPRYNAPPPPAAPMLAPPAAGAVLPGQYLPAHTPPPRVQEPDPSLLIFGIDSPVPPLRVTLAKSDVTIGREPGNDILLADPTVSRHHLRLTRESSMWQMERMPGAQFVYINGRQQDDAVLRAGDQLVIGGTAIRVEPAPTPAVAQGAKVTYNPTLLRAHLAPTLHVECPNMTFDAALRAETITLGRSPECGIIVPSPLISSHHATLIRRQSGDYLLDTAQARNLFQLRGEPVARRVLVHGDTLLLGARAWNQFVAITYIVDHD